MARGDDETYALIREALHASGDIIPGDGTLTIGMCAGISHWPP